MPQHHAIEFGYGSSTPLTTAVDVYEARAGVCRDFAHLAVTFCRAFSIPTRYAFGYLPDIGVPPPEQPVIPIRSRSISERLIR